MNPAVELPPLIRSHPADSAARPRAGLFPDLPEIWTLLRPLRWLFAGCFLLMIVNRVCGLAVPVALRYLVNNVMEAHRFRQLPWIIGAVVTATSMQGLTTFFLSQQLSITGQRLIADLRRRVQQHVSRLPVAFYDGAQAGALASRMMRDAEGIRDLAGAGLIDLLGGILTALIALVLLLHISLMLTLPTLCVLVVFALFLSRAFGITRPLFRERSELTAKTAGRLTQSLAAVRVVKGYRAESGEAAVFSQGVGRILGSFIRSITAQSWLSLASTVLFGAVAGLVMILGALQVRSHRLDIGSYVEFLMLLAFMVAPLALLVSVGSQLTEAVAGLDRTVALLREPDEDSDPRRIRSIGPIRGSVAFRDVSFAYLPDRPVLHEIWFDARPGTVTALVGASGSGKSTISSLLCGFYSALEGQILIDDIDLATITLDSYRRQLGIVLQDSFLFDGTIRENVLFSRPDATSEQWMEACRIAHVDEFAERLPDGYETAVGERGVRLSGGQCQRVSIARAILADPRILILDEATSSLDSRSEAFIQAGLASLMRGRTTFVIAHRLSTVRRADQILVLDRGRIVERGTHASLCALAGHYYDFYTRQHGLEAGLFLPSGEGEICPGRL